MSTKGPGMDTAHGHRGWWALWNLVPWRGTQPGQNIRVKALLKALVTVLSNTTINDCQVSGLLWTLGSMINVGGEGGQGRGQQFFGAHRGHLGGPTSISFTGCWDGGC